MTPNPEKVDWERVARAIAPPADLPAKPVPPPATGASGTWRIVAQDGSTSGLAASLSHPTPTVEGLVSSTDLPAGKSTPPSLATRPASTPKQGSPTSARSKIAMPLGVPTLSQQPEPERQAARRPAPSRLAASPRPLGSVAMNRGKLDPQLTRVMDAWPSLSGRTREAILAMIDVALGKK